MKPLHLPSAVAALAIGATIASSGVCAAPMTYRLDPNHSFVHFSYSHFFGFSQQEQRFNKVSGSVTYDPQAPTGAVDVAIDLRSVDTGSILDKDIQSPAFFDTARYPVATFKSTSVRFKGDQPAQILGNLTIKGITRPVTLKVLNFKHGQDMRKRPAIGADAETRVSRAAFDMKGGEPMDGDEVTIRVDLEAAAAAPPPADPPAADPPVQAH